ncbi:15720_t:CDS:1, partial [Acaulospora colombiana]
DFVSLRESALISLIKRNDLQMEEIKIWEKVIQWGIAKNPTLPSD